MKVPKDVNDKLKWRTTLRDEPLQFPYVEDIIHDIKPCEDCGLVVSDRRLSIRKMKKTTRQPAHWRNYCETCKLYQHPITKQFTITNTNEIIAILVEEENKETK